MEDVFTFQPRVYMGKKTRNGVHTGPQLLSENLDQIDTFEWTKAVVLSIFDFQPLWSHLGLRHKIQAVPKGCQSQQKDRMV